MSFSAPGSPSPATQSVAVSGRSDARTRAPRHGVTWPIALVGRRLQVGGAHERVDVLDLDAPRAGAVAGFHERDRELAMRRLARDDEVVAAADGHADLDDGIRIARKLIRLEKSRHRA